MAKIQQLLIACCFIVKGTRAASSASPVRKRIPLGKVDTDADTKIYDTFEGRTPALLPSIVRKGKRRTPMKGNVNDIVDREHSDANVNLTRLLSPSIVRRGRRRKGLEVDASSNIAIENSEANADLARQQGITRHHVKVDANGNIETDNSDSNVDSTRQLLPSIVRMGKRREDLESDASSSIGMRAKKSDKGSCSDTPNWYDSDGATYNCTWYASVSSRCDSYGSSYANFNKTANQACCACGGGQQDPTALPTVFPTTHPTAPPTAHPTPAPPAPAACSTFTAFESCPKPRCSWSQEWWGLSGTCEQAPTSGQVAYPASIGACVRVKQGYARDEGDEACGRTGVVTGQYMTREVTVGWIDPPVGSCSIQGCSTYGTHPCEPGTSGSGRRYYMTSLVYASCSARYDALMTGKFCSVGSWRNLVETLSECATAAIESGSEFFTFIPDNGNCKLSNSCTDVTVALLPTTTIYHVQTRYVALTTGKFCSLGSWRSLVETLNECATAAIESGSLFFTFIPDLGNCKLSNSCSDVTNSLFPTTTIYQVKAPPLA